MSTENAGKHEATETEEAATHEHVEHSEQGKDRVHLALVHVCHYTLLSADVKG